MNRIRDTYDELAVDYARHLFRELDEKPFDRQLLNRFLLDIERGGKVCDVGCGPGQVARYLHDRGSNVFGIDLSPSMVEQARLLSPNIPFHEGNMLALDLPDENLAGITAFYAIVNLPRDDIPAVFREMIRVLRPGGLLLLAFHVGHETIRPNELWGHPISMDFHLYEVGAISCHLRAAGFEIGAVLEREPYAPGIEYQSRRAYVFARKIVTAVGAPYKNVQDVIAG